MVVAILVDNGEPTLRKSIESLRKQTVPVRIVLAPGPKSDLSQARGLVDKIYPRIEGVGKARVNAIVNEKDEFILSCDADTFYSPNYAELAVQDLALLDFVKAGLVLPRGDYPDDAHVIAWAEAFWCGFAPYEFSLAFKRSLFLNRGIHLDKYNRRRDIGLGFAKRMIPLLPDPRMICYTRLPTKIALTVKENYLPSILGVSVPFAAVGSFGIFNELKKYFL